MPRAPIQSRTAFFTRLRDGSIRLLDWCLVDTELGPMMEPRQATHASAAGSVTDIDVTDASFTYLRELNEDTMYSQYGTSGRLIQIDTSL